MADLVSVVIPVYNTNERFKACFESVLKQKYLNIEVILVDDGSSDTSAQICDMVALSTSRFPVYVIHKPNGGVSRARNLGIDFANGKYLVFIDSDDRVTPDYVSDFMEARENYPDAGHIWCGFEWVSQNKIYIYSEKEQLSLMCREDYFALSGKILTQSPWLRLYDKTILKNYKIRMQESLSLAEDVIFNLEYLDAVPSTKICVINAPNYIYITSDDSLNFKYRDNLLEINELFLSKLKIYLSKWGMTDEDSVTYYYNNVLLKYTEVMNNTFNRNNSMPYFERIRFNNSILHKEEFTKALSTTDIYINRLLRRAYESKNYFFVRLFEKLVALYGCFK